MDEGNWYRIQKACGDWGGSSASQPPTKAKKRIIHDTYISSSSSQPTIIAPFTNQLLLLSLLKILLRFKNIIISSCKLAKEGLWLAALTLSLHMLLVLTKQ
jgi:hypothetical protein